MSNQHQNLSLEVVDVENLPGHRINSILNDGSIELDDGSTVQFSTNDILNIVPRFNSTLIYGAVSDIRDAMIIRDDNSTRFSRVKRSLDFLEKGTIKFDGFGEGVESLRTLKREFPKLHDAICYLNDNPNLIKQFEVMKDFRNFLLSVVSINRYAIFLLIDEIVPIQSFTKECCEYILHNSDIINVPDYSTEGDYELIRLTNELISSTTNLCSSVNQTG